MTHEAIFACTLCKVLDRAEKVRTFNSSGLDTLVFVHIQKTGGSTLERRFVENIGMIMG